MIPPLILILSLFISIASETNSSKTIYTIDKLVKETLQNNPEKDFNIFDPNKYIFSFHPDMKIKMKDIFKKYGLRIYFFYVYDIIDNPRFLSEVMYKIGKFVNNDPKATKFISVVFVINKNKYLFRIGGKVGKSQQKKKLIKIMEEKLHSFGRTIFQKDLGTFSIELLNVIKENIDFF